MKNFRPVLILILVCCALFLMELDGTQDSTTFSATFSDSSMNPETDKMSYIVGNSYVPRQAAEVLQASHEKYIEGCALIQAGELEQARNSFNDSVDLLLSPKWDVTSTLHLNHFFQELIQQIPRETSQYLNVNYVPERTELFPLKISPSLQSDDLSSHMKETSYEIPITVNQTVAKSIYYWLNDGRRFFVEGLKRSGQYKPIIERIFREESVPLDLMYIAQVESLFKPTAYSKARAKGIWQFNKSTAIQYGLKVTRDIDERSDPEKSTRAAARYLKDLYDSFGDWNLAMAAYNCGGARLKRVIGQTGIHDFWGLVRSGNKLPKETKNHIPLIHASIILARNPEIFGLPTELDPYVECVEVAVPKPVDLHAAAEVLNTTVRELKQLNPSLIQYRTPAGYPDFRLKVPVDSDINLRERLIALSKIAKAYS
ncbi:MAG: lytic transglycosylase domain-containing protein [Acidobacteriota bacterium]